MNVLIVDDDSMVRNALARMFRVAFPEHHVVFAEDPVVGLRTIAGGFIPDIVFTDWEMPRGGGSWLITSLRLRGFEVPIVIVSAADPRDIDSTGANAVVPKPATPDVVQRLFDELVLK